MESFDNSYEKTELPESDIVNSNLREIFTLAFIKNCSLDDASVTEDELKTLGELDEREVVNNIRCLMENLLNFKANCKSLESGELATRCDQLEKLLQNQEAEVRNHIKIEYQLKICIDTLQQKLTEIENHLSQARTSIREMESKGLETIDTKLQIIEFRFQNELNRVIKEYHNEDYNQVKNNERIKKLEEMFENKENAYIALLRDYTRLKQRFDVFIRKNDRVKNYSRYAKGRSGSEGGIKLKKKYKSVIKM
ncbi:hypothetical protein SteCoe_27110 [Stentor coeruleus]|uniref:Uncharacterized protein n=1 Tax=Stentor coeruleus TaxID=5963 RepID=A0A1R2BBC5_9CILI|nr:hypothetical protein SteCoe_27110 [Stentor coeruleus]